MSINSNESAWRQQMKVSERLIHQFQLKEEHSAPLRRSFLVTETGHDETPLSRLLLGAEKQRSGGGRGAKSRLSMLLSLLWLLTGDGHSTTRSSYELARLSGLSYTGDSTSKEVFHRRMTDQANGALDALHERGFITVDRSSDSRIIRLNREDPEAFRDVAPPKIYFPPTGQDGDTYLRIPASLWLRGTLARLSTPGLVTYLAALELAPGSPAEITLPAGLLKTRYAMTNSMRRAGIKDLLDLKVISVEDDPYEPTRTPAYKINPTYQPPRWTNPTPEPTHAPSQSMEKTNSEKQQKGSLVTDATAKP